MFNNQLIIEAIEGAGGRTTRASARQKAVSEPLLIERLPNLRTAPIELTVFVKLTDGLPGVLQRDAEGTLGRAALRQLRHQHDRELSTESQTSSSPNGEYSENELETNDLPIASPEPITPSSSRFSTISEGFRTRRLSFPFSQKAKEPWKEPHSYEVLRAIGNKDLMYLMEVRDRAFHLLLRKTGDVTPLLHAMRIGPSHREVAVVLVGALSRWVNHLDDDEVQKPRTRTLLKALRINLKLAIDYGLQSSQSDLLASFLQTLIMSEGDKWVWSQITSVGLALRSIPGEGKPVETAEMAVRAFATRELGKAAAIAALEDYIANATADLLMMAAWSLASQTVGGDPIPTYCFARDERVYSVFVTRINENQDQIARTCTRRLRWQIKLLEKAVKGRNLTFRRKVELLRSEMDTGVGP